MSEAYVGEVRMFGGSFAPVGWMLCDGQLLAIANQTALFSLIGTNFGGDGRTSFGLPDFRGRLPVGQGAGPGLTPRVIGQMVGAEQVTVTLPEMPSHTHRVNVTSDTAIATTFQNNVLAKQYIYQDVPGAIATGALPAQTIKNAGGGQPHNNMMPYLAITFIIATVGIFPQRQ